jgi:hypothetical protein
MYEAIKKLPSLWPEIIQLGEECLDPGMRDFIYAEEQKRTTKARDWFTCKRQPGVIGFVFPTGYYRSDVYPRLNPFGPRSNKLGLGGAHKKYRTDLLALFSGMLYTISSWELYELDLVSCHTNILLGLDIGAPKLQRVLDQGLNIWKEIDSVMTQEVKDKLPFNVLKQCYKRICYKCLQGGRVDTADKIVNSLAVEQKEFGEDIKTLGTELFKNPIVQEFDQLNKTIAHRYEVGH